MVLHLRDGERSVADPCAIWYQFNQYTPLVPMLAIFLVPRLVTETRELGAQLPTLIETNILTPLDRSIPMGPVRESLEDGVNVPGINVFGYVRGAATIIASMVAVLFMIVYMLIDAHRLRNLFLLFYPPEVRAERRRMLGIIGAILAVSVAAMIQVAFEEGFASRRERRLDVERAGTLRTRRRT
jgi:predicted PurR-regulated permease PerM